jgi:DNA-binding GntR family transcriptional regulator
MTRIPASDGIPRGYLHDEVAGRLRQMILDGELAPLERLKEIELARRFAISRTPLREAIRILATEGLLELLPNRGARVAAISERELDDMLEVVASLEATAAELAAGRMPEVAITDLEARHRAMLDAWRAGDAVSYARHNEAIHDAIISHSGNRLLEQLYGSLAGRIQRTRRSAPKTPEQWQRAVDEHEQMLVLLRARDGEGLARLMRSHIRGKRPVIKAAYGR